LNGQRLALAIERDQRVLAQAPRIVIHLGGAEMSTPH